MTYLSKAKNITPRDSVVMLVRYIKINLKIECVALVSLIIYLHVTKTTDYKKQLKINHLKTDR